MFSISLRKNPQRRKEKQVVFFDHQNEILFAHAIITSTTCGSSAFLSNFRPISMHIFLGLFSKYNLHKHNQKYVT